jgi:hypothetical protein
MIGEIVKGSGRGELLTELGNGRIGRVPPRTAQPREGSITRVEMYEHLAVVVILMRLDRELPMMWQEFLHASILERGPVKRQGRRSPISPTLD